MTDYERKRRERLEEEARIKAEAFGEQLAIHRQKQAQRRHQEEKDRREWEESQQRELIEENERQRNWDAYMLHEQERRDKERREHEEAIEEMRQHHAEELQEEREKHEEMMFEKREAARKHAVREAISLCYNAYGEKILGVYEGELKSNLPSGQGVLNCDDGDRYEGEFSMGRFEGFGKSYRADGSVRYEGEYKNGLFNGNGTFYYYADDKQGRHRYIGTFVNGRREGQGRLEWSDGTLYEGMFHDNEFFGKGVMTWPNGDRYEGEYKCGKRDGSGVYITAKGVIFDGEWRDNHREGKIVTTYPNGDRYECTWRDDKAYTGWVKMFDAKNRCIYDGEIKEGKRHGHGKSYFESGKLQYDGEWSSNYYSGKGVERDNNGNIIKEGTFLSGKLAGTSCTLYQYSGKELLYILQGRFGLNGGFEHGTCIERDFVAKGTFVSEGGANVRFISGELYYKDVLTLSGNIGAISNRFTTEQCNITSYYKQTPYKSSISVTSKGIVLIGINGNDSLRTSITYNDTKFSCVKIQSIRKDSGHIMGELALFEEVTMEFSYYLNGSGYYVIEKKSGNGSLYFSSKNNNDFLNYLLPADNGDYMILKGHFTNYLPNGECTIVNSTGDDWTCQESVNFQNGIKHGVFTWKKIDKNNRAAELLIKGEYIQGCMVDFATITYVNNAIYEEYIGHVDIYGEPKGLGEMRMVHYDDSEADVLYGIWDGVSCEKSMSKLTYMIKRRFDKHKVINKS